jgi:hypothetical protein
MSENKKPLTDEEAMTLVNQKVKESVSWYDSRLSKERQRVINYYNSVLPKRQHLGSSPYISTDVYDSVESMRSQICETFSANPDNLISFPALHAQDVESSRIATEYANHCFFAENAGLKIMSDWTHDGLTARTGVVKAFWEKNVKEEEHEVPAGTPYHVIQGLAAQSDISELDVDIDPHTALSKHGGKATRSTDTSKVVVENVPPEEFLISPRCPNILKADACSHRTLKSKADLLKMYPAKETEIEELHYDDDKGLDLGPEVLARNMPVETTQALDNPIQKEVEKVMLYESYVRMDWHDGKGVKLYKIVHVNEVLFEREEVDRAPFYEFCPLPISYMFYGNNFAARVIPYQNARTVLTRAILDHTAITTNPRWGVVKGGLLNPREMLENRLGGIVNMTRPDAVKALEQANLNPFVFQTLEMLKSNKEESTGISSLSQGLNKDAISTQNSAALVDNLVTLSQTRQKMIARQFARALSDLYIGIYKLVLDNQDKEKQKIIKVTGDFVPVTTKDWIDRDTCSVALHLGYGERDREAAKYAGLYKSLKEGAGSLFQPQNEYNLLRDGMKTAGFQNFADYITTPDKVPPPQPDPIKMGEVQAKTITANAAKTTADANAQRTQAEAQFEQVKTQLDELNFHLKALLGQSAEKRKDKEVASRVEIAEREMTLLEKQPITTETGSVAAH